MGKPKKKPEQPDLFGAPPPPPQRPRRKRIAYKETSREAYRQHAPIAGRLDQDIMRIIDGAGGIICEDIEKALGRSHQAVSGNLRHLVERKLVKFSGEFGKTSRNRKAMRWVLT